jgi:hypothetical protein
LTNLKAKNWPVSRIDIYQREWSRVRMTDQAPTQVKCAADMALCIGRGKYESLMIRSITLSTFSFLLGGASRRKIGRFLVLIFIKENGRVSE